MPLVLDYLISKFLVLKSTNADSNSFHRDKCRTNNQTAYAKASLLLSRVTFMYYGFTKRRPVCSFSPYWKRKIKLTSIHKTKIKIPLSTTIVERKWQRYVTIDRVCFPSIRMDFVGSLMKPNLSNNIQLFGEEEKPLVFQVHLRKSPAKFPHSPIRLYGTLSKGPVDSQISAHLKLQNFSSMNEIELLQFLFGPLIMCKLVDY